MALGCFRDRLGVTKASRYPLPGAALVRLPGKSITASPEVGKPELSAARAVSSPSPETAMARSSIIGLWPMTSTEPLLPFSLDQREVAGRVLAVELVQEQHAAGIGLPGNPFQRLARALGVGAERDVGNIAAGAHGRAGGFGIGMAGRVERPVEVAHARQRPAGLGVPQKKKPAHRAILFGMALTLPADPRIDLAMTRLRATRQNYGGIGVAIT